MVSNPPRCSSCPCRCLTKAAAGETQFVSKVRIIAEQTPVLLIQHKLPSPPRRTMMHIDMVKYFASEAPTGLLQPPLRCAGRDLEAA